MEEILNEKAQFISKNKDSLVCNLSSICYSLFRVLISDKSLKELEDYDKLLKTIHEQKMNITTYKDENYILHTILSFIDKVAINMEEKEYARKNILRYSGLFCKEKEKVLVKQA